MAALRGGYSSRSCGPTAFDNDQDFEEEEVWAIMKAKEGASNSKSKTRKSPSNSLSAWRFTSPSRAIPRSTTPSGGGTATRQSSAPINIPDWSKMSKKMPKKNLWDDECDAHNDDDRRLHHQYGLTSVDDGDDDNEDMLPPHEYLARRLAGTQIAPFSMCEGIGRTLKGRDLSNLRNAILTKTGFLE